MGGPRLRSGWAGVTRGRVPLPLPIRAIIAGRVLRFTPAFGHLNLRRNPFGEPPARAWAGLAVVEPIVDELARRLATPGFAVQVLGDAGRGKSTFLRVLHARFSDLPYTYLAEGEPPPPIPQAPIVFVDEAQRLAPRVRARLFSRRASFALASHADHERELGRAGVEVLAERVGALTSAKLVRICRRRIEWARRGAGPVPEVPASAAEQLIDQHGDDLRAIGDHLYEVFQTMTGVGNVEV